MKYLTLSGRGASSIRSRAFLRSVKNVRRGVLTRSRIIDIISVKACTLDQLSKELGLSESSIRRHLKNMLAEGVVEKIRYKGKVLWKLGESGQLDLEEASG